MMQARYPANSTTTEQKMPSSSRFRGFLSRAVRRVKKAFKPSDQASTSCGTPCPPFQVPPRDPPRQLPLSQEAVLPIQPQPTAQTQPAVPVQPPSPGQPAPITSPLATDGNQLANAESSLALAAKKDAWSGLKAALQLLERSSDAFPPLKSAVAGFLGVVDIFEASNLTTCVHTY